MITALFDTLIFNVKINNINLIYTITTNNINLPGLENILIENKISGNFGILFASNELVLDNNTSEESFIINGFSEGMVIDINNTFRTLVNVGFNILCLKQDRIVLSYEGPFWDISTDGEDDDLINVCKDSPFNILAFNSGFSQDLCLGDNENLPGPFSDIMFNELEFRLFYGSNENLLNEYTLNTSILNQILEDPIDLIFLNYNNTIYILGKNIYIINAKTLKLINQITLNKDNPIKLIFNSKNNLLYALFKNGLVIFNPINNTLVSNLNFIDECKDIAINSQTGDVYISFSTNKVKVWSMNNTLINPTQVIDLFGMTEIGSLVYNFIDDLIVLWSDISIFYIDSNRNIIETVTINTINYLFYNRLNNNILAYQVDKLISIKNGIITQLYLTNPGTPNIILNTLNNTLNISEFNSFKVININGNIIDYNVNFNGKLTLNTFDGDVYISENDIIYTINPNNGFIANSQVVNNSIIDTIYNPINKSIVGIENNNIFELKVKLNNSIGIIPPTTPNQNIDNDDDAFGTLDPNYIKRPTIWLKSRSFLRKPRANFIGDVNVEYIWKWDANYDNNPFFLYDFSGDQLEKDGAYAYIGEKPLNNIVLSKDPNRDLDKVADPSKQQTIFSEIKVKLDYINSLIDDPNNLIEPLQLFIGYKSILEGTDGNTLRLIKRELINVIFDTNQNNYFILKEITQDGIRKGLIELNETSEYYFTEKGLKPNQFIAIYLKDITNSRNQYTSENNSSVFKIEQIFNKSLLLNFVNPDDFIVNENTIINSNTFLRLSIKVLDKEIGRFSVFGETEDEDERFKIELGNLGKLIDPNDVFIFKEYDILEGGIDWKILNKKRKEMLMMKHLIYPYIGAYKSIINAINYFSYNDLQLNEYYRNINVNSENFDKLFKVEIPDIFDNSVEGWEESDFVKNLFPNENYEETKLFNLTYFITDKEGNNILTYTLDEVIIKLQGLKYWLQRNIIPLTHKILDITGQLYIPHSNIITHKLHDIQIFNIKEEMTPITTKLTEVYLMPVNSGSAVYNCVLEFFSIIPNIGSDDINKPLPFNGSNLFQPDYFSIKIRTYQTYKEWNPLFSYKKGNRIKYLNRIFESVINNNKINNPYKYQSVPKWNSSTEYKTATIVNFERDFYSYKGDGTIISINPRVDTTNWLKITEWIEIDYEPIQTINEYRKGDKLEKLNFTIDSNIDPIITIEVTSDNGYGEIYTDKKNYEIIGINEIVTIVPIDQLPSISSNLKIKDDPNLILPPTIDIDPPIVTYYEFDLKFGSNCNIACII